MSASNEFDRRMAERAAEVRDRRQAEQDAIRQAARDEKDRLAEIEAREEAWFPKARKYRDDDFDELLRKAGAELKAGSLKHKGESRAYWSQLVSDKFEIALGIIPVPPRGVIIMRASAIVNKNRIPHQIYDQTLECSPNEFDQGAMAWVEEQVIEMTIAVLAQQD